MIALIRMMMYGCLLLTSWGAFAADASGEFAPSIRTFNFHGVERKFFVALPADFRADRTYWPLVVVHGGGGNAETNRYAVAMRRLADQQALPAIVIMPEFVTADRQAGRFPALGEDAFLKEVLRISRSEYKMHEKILLNGYSMGGQFAHRFALANPDLVQACAPFAAGTWTTPDGRLLIEGFGEVSNPQEFLSNAGNKKAVIKRLHDLFNAKTASVAGQPAVQGAKVVPFLVMCGTLDPRHAIAVEFASSLRKLGYTVEESWPVTPHASSRSRFTAEFEKYSEEATRFFKKHTDTHSN